jgi:hypothetical protein
MESYAQELGWLGRAELALNMRIVTSMLVVQREAARGLA